VLLGAGAGPPACRTGRDSPGRFRTLYPGVPFPCYSFRVLTCDLYPAEAVLPDGQVLRGVRVQVSPGGRLLVWRDVTGVAQTVFTHPVVEHVELPERGTVWHQARLVTQTDAGQVVANQTRPGGCNCSNSALAGIDERDAVRVDEFYAQQQG
jgi:hypothetical protein